MTALGHQLQSSFQPRADFRQRFPSSKPQEPAGVLLLFAELPLKGGSSLCQVLPELSDEATLKDSGSQAVDETLRT